MIETADKSWLLGYGKRKRNNRKTDSRVHKPLKSVVPGLRATGM